MLDEQELVVAAAHEEWAMIAPLCRLSAKMPGSADGPTSNRPMKAYWYVKKSSTGARQSQQWGSITLQDVPVPGDYDGDGQADYAVWRRTTGYWYIRTATGVKLPGVQWGASGDTPVTVTSQGSSSPVPADTILSLNVTPTDRTISLGQTKQFMATATYSISGTKDVTTTANWVSSNKNIATIDSKALATSVSQGTTTITASIGGKSSSTPLTVGPVTLSSMTITNGFSNDLLDGQTVQLHLTGTYTDGSGKVINRGKLIKGF